MSLPFNEGLLHRLPLVLAQIYSRAHNAKTPQDRHHAAYYLWEATVKLLAGVAIVEYAELGDDDPELARRLQNLARPSIGNWWEFVRRLVPVLADRGDAGFAAVRDLLLGRSRDDLPYTAGLDTLLLQELEGREGGAQSTVRLTEFFHRLVRYRNRELGHGALGQKPVAFYDRVGRALLAGLPELLERLDPLAGRRLLYIADVRRQASGAWLAERYELRGMSARRLQSLELADGEAVRELVPERLYLAAADSDYPRVCLHPLLVYDPDTVEVMFLNARRGRKRIEYLSYSSGRTLDRAELIDEQRELLARVLHLPVDASSVDEWATRSHAEEQAEGVPDEGPASPRSLGEFELLSELGRGGMGVVYRAWQPSLGRQVAVKALFRTGDPKAEARFAREIRALGHVEHPHLVKIFTSGSEGEQWFYAMELVEGATLAAVCDKLQSLSSHPETVDFQAWQEAVSTVCAEARQAEKLLSNTPSTADGQAAAPAQPGSRPADTLRAPLRVGRNYVRQVVELTRQVAEAAHALHERGILHRDIKPGNIMVTPDGDQAVLMDLGLAQIADEIEGRLTKTRQFVGTLRYASPEQVLAVGGLDRRSDVYSLGATLWELITLRPMFNATDQTPTPDLMRRIQIEDPEHPRKHHPGLSRDLDAIVLKCLDKDPKCRYATAADLVRDLEHFQAGEPVQARPVGEMQRAWRWCRRNPAIASMLGALAVVIVGSLIALTGLYLNADYQRQDAERSKKHADEQRKSADKLRKLAEHKEAGARAVTKFYEEHVLAAVRPKGWAGGTGRDVTLKEALDRAGPKIPEAFAGQPELEAAVRDTLGMTYYYLGQYEGDTHLETAYQIRLKVLGLDDPDTLTSLDNLSMLRWKQENIKEAISLARKALAKRREVLGPEHADTIWTQLHLVDFLTGEDDKEGESLVREAIEICERKLGTLHHQTAYAYHDLALFLNAKGQYTEAAELNRKAFDGRSKSFGAESPEALRSIGNLAATLWNLGKLEEAEALERRNLEVRKRVLGDGHTETFWSMRNLAGLLAARGNLAEAEQLRREAVHLGQKFRGPDDTVTLEALTALGSFLRNHGKLHEAGEVLQQAIEGSRRKLGNEHPLTLSRQGGLAWLLANQGKPKEAEPLYRTTYETQRRVCGPEHLDTLVTQHNLAVFLSNEGKYADAEAQYRTLVEICRRIYGADHPETLIEQRELALVLAKQQKLSEAEALYRSIVEVRIRLVGPDNPATWASQNYLATFLGNQGRLQEAEKLHRQILEIRRRVLGAESPDTLTSHHNLAWVLERQGKLETSEELYRQTLEGRRRALGLENPSTLSTQANLAVLLGKRGNLAEAEKLFQQVIEIEARTLGPGNPSTMPTQNSLAGMLAEQGKLQEAEKLYRQILETRRSLVGAEHRDTLLSQHNLAWVLDEQGRLEEAEKLYEKTLEMKGRVLGAEDPSTLQTQNNLAAVLRDQGKFIEAEKLCKQTLESRRRLLGQEHPDIVESQSTLALLYEEQGKLAEAEKLLRQTLESDRGLRGRNNPLVLPTQHSLARVLGSKREIDEAKTLFTEVVAVYRKTFGPEHLDLASVLADFGVQLADNARAVEAEPLLREALTIREKKLPPGHWQIANARSLHGGCLGHQDKFSEAEPLVLAGYEGAAKSQTPPKRVAEALDRIIELYERWGKAEQAELWRKKRAIAGK